MKKKEEEEREEERKEEGEKRERRREKKLGFFPNRFFLDGKKRRKFDNCCKCQNGSGRLDKELADLADFPKIFHKIDQKKGS